MDVGVGPWCAAAARAMIFCHEDWMKGGTGSGGARRRRAGTRTSLSLLLAGREAGRSGRGDSEAPAAELMTHQDEPRRNRPFPGSGRLLSRPRIALAIALIVVAGAAVGAWILTRPASSAGVTTRIVPVSRITLSQTLSASGTIEPKKSTTLSFSAPGQVTAVEVQAGERVVKGQPLASMDSPTLKAQAAQAEAGLAGAQSQLSQDQAGSVSSIQLAADQASVNAAQSQVNSANAALSGATLTAPFSGIITGTGGLTLDQQLSGGSAGGSGSSGSASSGSGSSGSGSSGSGDSGSGSGDSGSGSANSGSASSATGEITLVSANDIVTANVDASVVGHIKAGDQVEITTEGAAGPVSGTVHSIGLIADTSSGVATFPVVIDVTGTPSGLYAGASATTSIIYHQVSKALVVPSAAIRQSGPHTVVDVMSGGHQAVRDVTTGLTSGGLTQITRGLTAGERVVVESKPITTSNPGNGSTVIAPGGRVLHVHGGPGGFVQVGG
jgi:macrolide-specific efflux system membrane fusion protein